MQHSRSFIALSIFCLVVSTGCSSTSVERGAQGALTGAAAGAVGSMFAAAIFGGDIGDAAARGAAWGAGAGAVSGAIQGSQEDARKREREAAEAQRQQLEALNRLRAEIGDDTFAGLSALAEGKHEVAMAYAKTAARSSNEAYALAGHWLEVLTWQDSGDTSAVAEHLPHLVAKDDHIDNIAQARSTLAELGRDLQTIRKEYGIEAG